MSAERPDGRGIYPSQRLDMRGQKIRTLDSKPVNLSPKLEVSLSANDPLCNFSFEGSLVFG
jgi:hypothetical protein